MYICPIYFTVLAFSYIFPNANELLQLSLAVAPRPGNVLNVSTYSNPQNTFCGFIQQFLIINKCRSGGYYDLIFDKCKIFWLQRFFINIRPCKTYFMVNKLDNFEIINLGYRLNILMINLKKYTVLYNNNYYFLY